jgi:hypothetical protein
LHESKPLHGYALQAYCTNEQQQWRGVLIYGYPKSIYDLMTKQIDSTLVWQRTFFFCATSGNHWGGILFEYQSYFVDVPLHRSSILTSVVACQLSIASW